MRPTMTAIATARAPFLPAFFAVIAIVARWLKQLVRAYKNRRDAQILAGLEQNLLADIGVSRSDVRDAFSEPLWQDPTVLLRARALERRLSRHGLSTGFEPPAGDDAFVAPPLDRPARFTL